MEPPTVRDRSSRTGKTTFVRNCIQQNINGWYEFYFWENFLGDFTIRFDPYNKVLGLFQFAISNYLFPKMIININLP